MPQITQILSLCNLWIVLFPSKTKTSSPLRHLRSCNSLANSPEIRSTLRVSQAEFRKNAYRLDQQRLFQRELQTTRTQSSAKAKAPASAVHDQKRVVTESNGGAACLRRESPIRSNAFASHPCRVQRSGELESATDQPERPGFASMNSCRPATKHFDHAFAIPPRRRKRAQKTART